MINLFFSLLIGVLLGVFTGLIPGIHPNLIATFILSLSLLLLKATSPLYLAVIILGMSVSNLFLNILPSIFLGAPDESTILSVLPGHRMLLNGCGYEAVVLTLLGAFFSLILIIALSPLLLVSIKYIYPTIKVFIPFVLLVICSFLILREKNSRAWAFFTFFLAGILGISVLTMPNLKEPLFPLLSGLFGVSVLAMSLYTNPNIPLQSTKFPKIEFNEISKPLFSSVFIGSIVSILPGIGPSEAAIISSQFTKITERGFLFLVGGLSAVNMALGFITLYAIEKARNGPVVVISRLLNSFTINHLILFLGCILVAAGISILITLKLSKIFSRIITKINYKLLCISIIALIALLSFYISGFLGLFILLVSTALGIIPTLKGIGKNHLMGCLLLPVILYFLL